MPLDVNLKSPAFGTDICPGTRAYDFRIVPEQSLGDFGPCTIQSFVSFADAKGFVPNVEPEEVTNLLAAG
jgi:hypothetical protein